MTSVASTTGKELRWFLNTLVSIVVSAKSGKDETCVIEHWMPKGDSPPLHRHEREDEIFHILEGTIRFRVGESDLTAKAGDTVLAPKGIPHSYIVESPDGAHCLTITRGSDFETMVSTVSRIAAAPTLPQAMQPTPAMIDALVTCCRDNRIDILGPPLG